MCGYAKDTLGRSATPAELAEQLDRALARYQEEPYVKVYTSGSFLDDREVDPASRAALVRAFSGRARRLLFETLPEFATSETLEPLREAFSGEVEVALGLESTHPDVLGRLVHKNAPPREYLDAGDRVRALGLRAKAYLLLKPPYLTESEAIRDVLASIVEASPHFDALSVNPVHIQNGTVVEWMYPPGTLPTSLALVGRRDPPCGRSAARPEPPRLVPDGGRTSPRSAQLQTVRFPGPGGDRERLPAPGVPRT